MEQVYTPTKEYKVLVRCFTYNQSKYIEDALNGFAMQKTDFPFVCLVMDDASSDGEQEVIKSWIARECNLEKAENVEIEKSFVTIIHHKANPNCTFAFYFLKENLYKKGRKMQMVTPWREHCEYEAICEGDDYWIHPEKLQMQADYLDMHPDYTMCFHNAIEHWEDGTIPDRPFAKLSDSDYNGIDIFKDWIVPTASVVLRNNIYYSELFQKVRQNKKFVFGDSPLFVTCAELGKVHGFPKCMSVYRRNDTGVSNIQASSYYYLKARAFHFLEFQYVFGDKYREDAEQLYLNNCWSCFLQSIKNRDDSIQWWGLLRPLRTDAVWTVKALFRSVVNYIKSLIH